jgi:hypothetical protein
MFSTSWPPSKDCKNYENTKKITKELMPFGPAHRSMSTIEELTHDLEKWATLTMKSKPPEFKQNLPVFITDIWEDINNCAQEQNVVQHLSKDIIEKYAVVPCFFCGVSSTVRANVPFRMKQPSDDSTQKNESDSIIYGFTLHNCVPACAYCLGM